MKRRTKPGDWSKELLEEERHRPSESMLDQFRKLAQTDKIQSINRIPAIIYIKHFERKPSLLWPLDELESTTFSVKLRT